LPVGWFYCIHHAVYTRSFARLRFAQFIFTFVHGSRGYTLTHCVMVYTPPHAPLTRAHVQCIRAPHLTLFTSFSYTVYAPTFSFAHVRSHQLFALCIRFFLVLSATVYSARLFMNTLCALGSRLVYAGWFHTPHCAWFRTDSHVVRTDNTLTLALPSASLRGSHHTFSLTVHLVLDNITLPRQVHWFCTAAALLHSAHVLHFTFSGSSRSHAVRTHRSHTFSSCLVYTGCFWLLLSWTPHSRTFTARITFTPSFGSCIPTHGHCCRITLTFVTYFTFTLSSFLLVRFFYAFRAWFTFALAAASLLALRSFIFYTPPPVGLLFCAFTCTCTPLPHCRFGCGYISRSLGLPHTLVYYAHQFAFHLPLLRSRLPHALLYCVPAHARLDTVGSGIIRGLPRSRVLHTVTFAFPGLVHVLGSVTRTVGITPPFSSFRTRSGLRCVLTPLVVLLSFCSVLCPCVRLVRFPRWLWSCAGFSPHAFTVTRLRLVCYVLHVYRFIAHAFAATFWFSPAFCLRTVGLVCHSRSLSLTLTTFTVACGSVYLRLVYSRRFTGSAARHGLYSSCRCRRARLVFTPFVCRFTRCGFFRATFHAGYYTTTPGYALPTFTPAFWLF